MKVVYTNSWQSQLGNLLGNLIGNNYQKNELNKAEKEMKEKQQKKFSLLNPTEADANDWLNKQTDLMNIYNEGDVSDEAFTKLSGMVGGNTDKYRAIRDAGQSVMRANSNYANATDDASRQAAHQEAVNARKILAQYGYEKGFGEADNVTFDSLKDMHQNLMNDFKTDAYEQWRNSQLSQLTGMGGLLGKRFNKF